MFGTCVMLADRYRLEHRIAVGGAGEVWRATDLVLERPVAVKVLRPEYAGEPEALARFRAEARHAGALAHPGIAQVFDYGEEPPYLVMELVDGPSLAKMLAAGPLSPGRTMDIVAQTAAALDAAHRAGLVHRDIKPANLLLRPDGRVKVTDFGIAHAAGSAQVTRTGLLVGTPAYLAPERAAGATATPASDLYSLGVVAYECLAGSPPFHGTPLEVAAAHQHRTLPPLSAGVPPDVAALVRDLTAKDPAARPATAAGVAARAEALRATLAGPPTPGEPTPAPPPTLTMPAPATVEPTARLVWPKDSLAAPVATEGGAHARGRARRGLLLAVAGTTMIAGLAGWLLAGLSSPAPHAAPAQSRSPDTAAPHTVMVSRELVGLPASVVRRQLHLLGLGVHVLWIPGSQQPGTVVSVQPTGQVRPGSTVTVTAVYRPHHGHGHDHGNGQGQGGDGGD